jgi:hypothetical protein
MAAPGIRPTSALIVLAWCLPLFAEDVDVLYFSSGDRLTGTIKRLDQGELIFSTPLIDGDVAINWESIVRIDSPRLFQFETASGERFLGELQPPGEGAAPTKVLIKSPDGDRLIERKEIILATQTTAGLKGLLTANVGAGMNLTKSNQLKQFSANGEVGYATNKLGVRVDWASIFGSQTQGKPTNRHEVSSVSNWYTSRRWGLGGVTDFLNSEEEQLALRTVVGGGPIYRFVTTNRLNIYGIGGAVWTTERYQANSGRPGLQKEAEGLLGIDISFFHFRQFTTHTAFSLYPGITVAGRFRGNWQTQLKIRLIRNQSLWWNFTQTITFNTKPPSNAPGSDYVTSTSVTWSYP